MGTLGRILQRGGALLLVGCGTQAKIDAAVAACMDKINPAALDPKFELVNANEYEKAVRQQRECQAIRTWCRSGYYTTECQAQIQAAGP
jgi:hypothetical protein